MGEFMILNKKYAFLTAFIFSFLSAAVAMENNEDIFNGTYVIKNVHTNKFIGYREKLEQTGNTSVVEDFNWEDMDEYHEGDETVIIHPGIFKESICSIEKSSEGYSIKNHQFEGYLFINTESRVAVWTKGLKTPSANCYFDILKGEDENKDKYFFKSKKFHDYLSFDISLPNKNSNLNRLQKLENSASLVRIDKKLVLSNNKDARIYFTFHPFDPSVFNIHSLTKKKFNFSNVEMMTNNNNIDQNIVPNNNKNIINKKMGPTNVIRTKKKNIDIDQNIVPKHNDKEDDDGNNKN